jgi:hypothetical protein
MTALGMYFYNAAKLVPFIFVLYFLISIIIGVKKNNYILSRLRGFLLLTLAALITFYPLITYILSPGSNYLGRVSGMSFQGTLLNAQQFFQYFPAQVSTSIAGIFRDSGAFGISSLPSGNLLDPVSAILLILGTAVTASLWKRPKYLFMIAWLAAGLSGIIFAVHFDKVYVHRAGSVMPALVILMAMALDFMATAFEKIFGKPGRLTTPVILGVLLFPIAFTSVNNYFTVYKNDPAVRFFRNSILQRAADFVESDKNRNVFFSAGFSGEKFDKLLVMLPRLKYPEGFTDVSLPDFGRIYNDKKKDVVIIAEGLYDTFMPVYREYFPDAVIKKHWYPDYWLFEDAEGFKKLYGWNDPDYIVNSIRTASLFTGDHAKPQVGFVSCEIPYGDIEALYGFHACYYRAGKQVSEGKLMNGETPAAVPFDKLVLSGMMDVPVTGEYSFYAEGCEAVEFAIAGIPVKKGRVKLLRGLNPVRIVLGHIGGSLNIAWLKPDNGGKQEKIPAGNVIDSKKLFGLLYKTVLNGKILYEMRDYSVNNRIYYSRVFNRTPYNITEPLYSRGIIYCERVWDGFINIAENGYYSFMDKCVNDCAVVIDGRKAYENKQYTRMPGGEMFLTRGKHRFHLSQHYSVGDDCDYSLILYKKTEWKAPVDVTYDMLSMQ